MTLKVSVIVPTHDRPAALAEAAEAVWAQTHRPCELIIVNDGERDISPQIADQAAVAGVKLIHHRRDVPSLPASRNFGMKLAGGDVVLFLEDDVTIAPDYLARLVALYEADADGLVAGIGGRVVEHLPMRRRFFNVVSAALGQGRWSPRICAARYVALPAALRGRLCPARRLSGGATSLRSSVARRVRFEEDFAGYAIGEDREFSFRVGRRFALFVAPELVVVHTPAPSGRSETRQLGRSYVANSLHIARRSVDGGAGTWLLVGYDLAGMVLLYSLYAVIGRGRGEKVRFVAGMIQELFSRCRRGVREFICGC